MARDSSHPPAAPAAPPGRVTRRAGSPRRTALGWRGHSGWAVAVVVSGVDDPTVLWRERVELVAPTLPRQPYHAVADLGMTPRQGARLIARVEKAATARAGAATTRFIRDLGVTAVGIVGGERNLPTELERVLASHTLLHASEGDLYEQVLAAAATAGGLRPLLVSPRAIEVPPELERVGKVLGPPWQKDHKLAAAAAVMALRQVRRR
jgi:hypothetical protein